MISMTMAVGGQALHWGGACNRFSEEDLRLKSMYGLADDWPIDWTELEKFYVQAEHRLNVAGDPSPYPEDRRSGPYPQPAMPLSYNLQVLKKWAEQSGLKFSPLPMSRNVNGALRRPRRMRSLRHVRRCVSDRRALFTRLHLSTADRGEEGDAARSHAGPQARAGGRPRHDRRRARVSPGSAERDDGVSRPAVRARVGPVLESAPAAAVGELALPERHRESIGSSSAATWTATSSFRRRRRSTTRRSPART